MAYSIDAVVIGRNEGARLAACLAALHGQVRTVVYVDSGSTDHSVVLARQAGAEVVALDMTEPFTAARARNAGLLHLGQNPPDFVQLIDGDCVLQPGWIAAALAGFVAHPKAVVICGRRRERFPEASVYNALADREWDTPIGRAKACGGDALIRYLPLMAGGGYREDLIAGEEPELCIRLARAGGEIWRIEAEMTLHDAALLHFGQWWRRMQRAGHAFAEGAALHGAEPERHWVTETRRALFWGAGLPLAVVLAGIVHPMAWLLVLIWPAQMLRLAAREGFASEGWHWAIFTVIGRFAEAKGALGYRLKRLLGRRQALIEYK